MHAGPMAKRCATWQAFPTGPKRSRRGRHPAQSLRTQAVRLGLLAVLPVLVSCDVSSCFFPSLVCELTVTYTLIQTLSLFLVDLQVSILAVFSAVMSPPTRPWLRSTLQSLKQSTGESAARPAHPLTCTKGTPVTVCSARDDVAPDSTDIPCKDHVFVPPLLGDPSSR